jgi:hypothetical protein
MLTDGRARSQFTHELSTFHDAVMSRKNSSKRIHIHLFETLVGKVRKAESKRQGRANRAAVSGLEKPHENQRPEEAGDLEIDAASTVEDRELCVREALVSALFFMLFFN